MGMIGGDRTEKGGVFMWKVSESGGDSIFSQIFFPHMILPRRKKNLFFYSTNYFHKDKKN